MSFPVPCSLFPVPCLAQISLLHPALAAAGLAAGAIPILIHLINRRRHRRVPWAAMAFLQQAIRRRARRLRLEQWLLLAIRAGMLILLGLALARPFLSESRLLPIGQTRAHRILLVDNSASMSALSASGQSAFEEARKAAFSLVDSIPATDAVSIVTLAAPARAVLGYASFDRREARDRLALLAATQRATDVSGALRQAEEILKDSPAAPANRIVYLISDMAAPAWSGGGDLKASAAVEAARRVAERAALVLAPVGGAEGGNLGISKLEAGAGAVAVKVPVRFTAEVTNYGAQDVRDAVLQIRRDERIERRIALSRLPARGRETVNFQVEFDAAGTYALAAHLETTSPDVLALDNDRYLSVNVAAALPVLIVGGTQAGGGLAAETGYLAMALNPWRESPTAGPGTGLIAPKTISDLEIGGEVLADYRVVALCNVGRLGEEVWRRLRQFVESGGGLLIFGGEAVNVEHYNTFGFAEGSGVLPGRLSAAVGATGGSSGFSFKNDEFAHPVVGEFAGETASGLFLARVERYLPIEPAGAGEALLRYANGEPAIALVRRGAGQCCFVTTTANMAWNNLPAKGDYVSLMMNLVTFLSHPAHRSRNLEVGEPIVRPLTAGEASLPLYVQLPSGETVDTAVTVLGPALGGREQGFSLHFEDTEQAGLYRTTVGAPPRRSAEETAFSRLGAAAPAVSAVEGVAVNVPAAEGDLSRVDEGELAGAITGAAAGADLRLTFARDPAELTRLSAGLASVREVGPESLYLVLGLLLLETWLAATGSRHAGASD